MEVITSAKESRNAYRMLKEQLEGQGEKHTRTIGHAGGNLPNAKIYWLPRHEIWSYVSAPRDLGRHWICFGEEIEASSLSITVECNPPLSGVNRQTAGAFLADGNDLYFAHSGKIGGGRKGIGMTNFLDWYLKDSRGTQEVFWPDGKPRKMIILGKIGSAHFPATLARFVKKVGEFKRAATLNETPPPPDISFSAEFGGKKTYEISKSTVEANVTHNLVVDEIERRIATRFKSGNSQQVDLFVANQKQQTIALFEVKTSTDTTSFYGGVGQLSIHGANLTAGTPRVLVIPSPPVAKFAEALKKLGIVVLNYELTEGIVTLGKIPPVLREIIGN